MIYIPIQQHTIFRWSVEYTKKTNPVCLGRFTFVAWIYTKIELTLQSAFFNISESILIFSLLYSKGVQACLDIQCRSVTGDFTSTAFHCNLDIYYIRNVLINIKCDIIK